MNVEIAGPGVPHLTRRDIIGFVRKVMLAVEREFDEISIALVNDRTVRGLNRKFRGKNRSTDVLTFPGDDSCEIVISLDQARRQAAAEGHSLPTEIRYLLLHGILHGLGYDHEKDEGQMNALELRVREAVGLD
ncbi:MAG TPA: rRNA maturation RNase YbeY [Thermoanaerobaculia bacterium]|nr:rRNA maturation RNase YbeY [Thermoanaerobaculia bacterium]